MSSGQDEAASSYLGHGACGLSAAGPKHNAPEVHSYVRYNLPRLKQKWQVAPARACHLGAHAGAV